MIFLKIKSILQCLKKIQGWKEVQFTFPGKLYISLSISFGFSNPYTCQLFHKSLLFPHPGHKCSQAHPHKHSCSFIFSLMLVFCSSSVHSSMNSAIFYRCFPFLQAAEADLYWTLLDHSPLENITTQIIVSEKNSDF